MFDSLSAAAVTGALSVTPSTSATAVVVEAGSTGACDVARVVESIRDVGGTVIGIVLNSREIVKMRDDEYDFGAADAIEQATPHRRLRRNEYRDGNVRDSAEPGRQSRPRPWVPIGFSGSTSDRTIRKAVQGRLMTALPKGTHPPLPHTWPSVN